MNEIEYRNRLIENIELINELILKVQKKNKYFNIILVILIIIIIFLLIIILSGISFPNFTHFLETLL